ncbi:hypothetical protein PHLGIDRAFT_430342 [Phlebiopsis gigantea 11061_1 CR5-6]|uniref:Uncharacterized protein n=1 Tax=Phlebiopsis gigantea (strain 11061_1 CR5-6) TaxID=745531 RepID=A0A0C3NPP5_PHLG1|nr:hypothetical protein PHLGIDRAFT_430342 [Phlebiopsis gigantea 11061_1 CR5-6]
MFRCTPNMSDINIVMSAVLSCPSSRYGTRSYSHVRKKNDTPQFYQNKTKYIQNKDEPITGRGKRSYTDMIIVPQSAQDPRVSKFSV